MATGSSPSSTPANGSTTNDNTPAYVGTALAGSTVVVRVDGNIVCTVTATAGGTFTCTPVAALADGSHTVNATAADAVGNGNGANDATSWQTYDSLNGLTGSTDLRVYTPLK